MLFLDGIPHEVNYVAFEFNAKPVYIASVKSLGGTCWSITTCDISKSENWLSMSIDNFHMQYNISGTTNLTVRFLFHAIRTGEYPFHQFINDLKIRDKIIFE